MSAMKLDEAVSTVNRFAKMFEAVQTLASEIDNVGKIKQLGDEAQARLDGFAEKEAAAKASLDEISRKVEQTRSRETEIAAKISSDASDAADRLIKKARSEAQGILEQADRMAAERVSRANAEAEPLVASAEAARKEWTEVSNKLVDGKRELQALESKIAQARQAISQLMKA